MTGGSGLGDAGPGDLRLGGPAAPPRVNGELVFERPWQRRVFASTMALCDAGVVDHEDFRRELVAQIGGRDGTEHEDYWSAWQDAIEAVVARQGICDHAELAHRAATFTHHR